mgnify:CR=1 FL=1
MLNPAFMQWLEHNAQALDAGDGDPQVEVGGERFLDKRRQLRVVELGPPAIDARDGGRVRRRQVDRRQWRLGRRAGRQRGRERERKQGSRCPHSSPFR